MDGDSCVDAGIVIDLSPINSVELQPDGLVHPGPAARTVEIITTATTCPFLILTHDGTAAGMPYSGSDDHAGPAVAVLGFVTSDDGATHSVIGPADAGLPERGTRLR